MLCFIVFFLYRLHFFRAKLSLLQNAYYNTNNLQLIGGKKNGQVGAHLELVYQKLSHFGTNAAVVHKGFWGGVRKAWA